MCAAAVGLGIGQVNVYRRREDLFAITARCNLDLTREEPLAARRGDVRSTDDLGSVIGGDDVDVVILCPPPFLHLDQASAALAVGHHVVCEKPLVGSRRDAGLTGELFTVTVAFAWTRVPTATPCRGVAAGRPSPAARASATAGTGST